MNVVKMRVRFENGHPFGTISNIEGGKHSKSDISKVPEYSYIRSICHDFYNEGATSINKIMDKCDNHFRALYDFRENPELQDLCYRSAKNVVASIESRFKRFRDKAALAGFNYFVTLTRDANLVSSPELFLQKCKNLLRNLKQNHGWRYAGTFELSPDKGRLHAHLLVSVPPGELVGKIRTIRSYSTKTHRMETREENDYFRRRLGINDFKPIDQDMIRRSDLIDYILKYITKSNDQVFYCRGLKDYIERDVDLDEDVVAVHYYTSIRKANSRMYSIRYYLFDSLFWTPDERKKIKAEYSLVNVFYENNMGNVVQSSFL